MGDCCAKCASAKRPCSGLVALPPGGPGPIWGANPPRAGGGASGGWSGTSPGGASGGGSGTTTTSPPRLAGMLGDSGTTVNAAGASTTEVVAIGLAGLLVGVFGAMLMRKQNPVHVQSLPSKKRRRLRRARRSAPNLYRRR